VADVPEFENGHGFEAWLIDRPLEWSKAIAVRNALRVLPVVAANLDGSSPTKRQQSLIQNTWRAMFISWTACIYPSGDLKVVAAAAADTAAFIAAAETSGADTEAAQTANAASAAARAAATVGSAVAAAARSATLSARFAAIAAKTAGSDVWKAVAADCQHLQNSKDSLIVQPLWLVDVRANDRYQVNFPDWVRGPFDKFAESDWVQSTSWGLIVDWYRALLPNGRNLKPHSLFGEKADFEIAMQPDEFWEHEPDEIMDAIAEIVEQQGEERVAGIKQDGPNDVDPTRSNHRNNLDAEAIGKALSDNRQPLLFSLVLLQQQIAEYREQVRGNNHLDPAFKTELLGFLDGLNKSLEDLADLLPLKSDDPVSDENASAATRWLLLYKARVMEGLKEYCAPENVADTTLPVGVILGCGTVGALVAGPVGFGAGAFFGQLVIRHAKPGTVGDKLKEAIEADADDATQV